MAPFSSSFASLNLSAESFPAGQFYRDTHICSMQAAAAWWCSFVSVRSVTGSQILNLPITTINARVRPLPPPSTAPVTVTGHWSRDEPTINHQTWIIKRLLRVQACKKCHPLPKPEKDLAGKWLIHATENRVLFRYVLAQTCDVSPHGLIGRDAVGGWLVY